ncbi:MAG TPA: hypothetical protein PK610_06985, partial [Flavobacteriales bacterium]|nr:hypothetical protein [Flavobacteriales bacterium]
MSRQQIAKNNTDSLAIVQVTYYDHHGRAALSSLPAPSTQPNLKYRFRWNRPSDPGLSNISYSKEYFDKEQTECVVSPSAMSSAFGAGNYYSTSNNYTTGFQGYVPDAEGYPFVQIQYMPDGTGRASKIGSAGPEFQINDPHSVSMEYGSATQQRLNQLFGTDAGYEVQYQKNTIVDGNGQRVVSYLDGSGRVVATALAGEAPSNVMTLNTNTVTNVQTPIIEPGDDAQSSSTPGELNFESVISVDFEGEHIFSYGISPGTMANECHPELCMDCVYDLEFTITDVLCGQVIYTHSKTINGAALDNSCNGLALDTIGTSVIAVDLVPGSYQISKKLKVNQASLEYYLAQYLELNTCLLDYSDFLEQALAEANTSGCNSSPCILSCIQSLGTREAYIALGNTGAQWDVLFAACLNDCEATSTAYCDNFRQSMLDDVKPNGQYGLVTFSAGTYSSTDPLSVYYVSNDLPNTNAYWRNPVGGYKNSDGSTSYILNSSNVLVTPEHASITLTEFINAFQDSWADALLPYHPEYCYLSFCESQEASHQSDMLMLGVQTYDEAKALGYLNPLLMNSGQGVPANAQSASTFVDPFYTNNPSIQSQFVNEMRNYHSFNGVNYTIWQMAWFLTYCNGDTTVSGMTSCLTGFNEFGTNTCTKDLLWETFRDLYLELKANIYSDLQARYAIENKCYSGCFGTTAFNDDAHDFDCYNASISPTCSVTKYDADQDPLQPCSDFTVSLYSGKIPIFADRRQSPYYGLNSGALSTLVNGQISTFQGDFCETMCEQKIEEWMQDLSECGLTTPQYNAIKAEFLELCELGCDAQHASGASSLPTGVYTTGGNQSIHEILIDVLGSGYETAVCSELLINDVQPYGVVPDFQETYKLDTCGCDKVLYIKQLFLSGQPLPPGITSMDQLFAYTYGTPLTGVKNFACRCESAWTAGYPSTPYHPSLPWLSTSATYLSTTTPFLYIPSGVACPSCVNCETINGLVSSFHTRFTGLSSTHSNYGTLLATYINNALGYQLSSDEYLDFIEACGQESNVPSCTPTQELHDLQNLLYSLSTLPSGGFLTTSSNPVLMSNLSIWAGSTLAGYTAGSTEQYWTNFGTNGANPDQSPLTLYIGNGSPCTIVLTLASGSTNRWSKLSDIKNLTFVQNGCTSSYQFSATATFSTPGGWVTETIFGTTSCYPMATCVCGENLKLCNEFNFVPTIDPCVQTVLNTAEANAQSAYEEYMEGIIAEFTANYLSVCIGAAANSEYLNWSYPSNEYHYTLYYYDQAGQLVRTVPPKGVDGTFTASGVDANRPSGSRIAPSHTLTTEYRYNSFGQVVEQKTPDGGVSKFWYDKFGRIAVSQNAKQEPGYYYSYTRYDIYGRPFEVGQVQKSSITQISEAIVKNPSSLDAWIISGTRTEVTRTTYDRSISVSVVASKFTNGQNHLRNRISTVAHYFSYSTITPDLSFNHATHFSYDDHGNVTEMIQDMPDLGPIQHQYKKIQYVFEQISGNVKKVLYQKGSADQFLHEYFYDADNRIKEVYTSRDSTIWDRDAKYFYYRHGPLARVEHGHNKVQGEDFAYTINGWIKGVNSGTLNTTYDMGKDGVTGYLSGNTNVHNRVAHDKFGYILGYFNQDYKPVSGATPGNYFEPAYSGTGFGNASPSLYNGNIRHMITAIPTASNQVMGYAYQYDQLNRIKSMNAFRFVSGNSWSTGTSTTDYQTTYKYDANGNIEELKRRAVGLLMDDLAYSYVPNTNRLDKVDDLAGATPTISDDIEGIQSNGNYTYTAIGELKSDAQENIADITWRVDGKVRRVTRNIAGKVEMEFEYDAFGRRVLKIEKLTTTGGSPVGQDQWTYTYYVNDASGNVMATYKLTKGVTTETFKLDNQHIYGSKRLGMLVRDYTLTTRNVSTGINTHSAAEARNHRSGRRYYEYSNHLGNVLLVTSDRKIPYYSGSTFLRYEPQMISFSDYYPFGSIMPGR